MSNENPQSQTSEVTDTMLDAFYKANFKSSNGQFTDEHVKNSISAAINAQPKVKPVARLVVRHAQIPLTTKEQVAQRDAISERVSLRLAECKVKAQKKEMHDRKKQAKSLLLKIKKRNKSPLKKFMKFLNF